MSDIPTTAFPVPPEDDGSPAAVGDADVVRESIEEEEPGGSGDVVLDPDANDDLVNSAEADRLAATDGNDA